MSEWAGYDLQTLASMAGATLLLEQNTAALPTAEAPLSILHLALDSRAPGLGPETLFVAIRGASRDGHQFAADAYAKGVRCFLAEQRVELPGPANWLLHPDPRLALQQIAAAHRTRFSYPVVGITGSNGKTIVKEWLTALLNPDRFVVRNPRSYNSQIGVPLSVWGMRGYHELGLFEAGISQPGEMERLQTIILPDIGIMTNLGAPHDEGFKNRAQKLDQKLHLFRECRSILFCADQTEVATAIRTRYPDRELICWSAENRPANLQARFHDGQVTLMWQGQEQLLTLPFDDPFSRENLLHAISAALFLGVNLNALASRAAQLNLPDLRLKVQQGQGGAVLVNDAYSSDLGSLRIALAFAARQGGPGMPRTAVLSDIEESGLDPKIRYSQVAEWLRSNGYSRLIAVGPEISQAVFDSGLNVQRFPDTEALSKALPGLGLQGQVVLIKGARRFGLEKVADALTEKIHGTRLEIDLDALAHNFTTYRDRAPKNTRLIAMVKALGYGSGDAEVARVLEYGRADYLGVAYADEGVSLRQAGINMPILVLNAAPESLYTLLRFDLEPEICSLRLLDLVRTQFPGLKIHLKLDTGMHRLGLVESEVRQLTSQPERLRGLRLGSVFSHLSSSEDARHDEFTRLQLNRFEQWSQFILDAWQAVNPDEPVPLRHILNSAGMLRFPLAHFDMVRLGIGLYGFDPSGQIKNSLRTVSRLLTTVAQIREVAAGESVGYGRAARLARDTRVATLTIGYADGFRRSLGQGVGQFAAYGKRMPVIGNVCMDMCMADATHVPELAEGDAVEVFGSQISLEEMAEWMQTIPYEVLTGVSSRVKRVYLVE